MARRPTKPPTRRGVVPKAVDAALAHLSGATGAGKVKPPPPGKVIFSGGRGDQRRRAAIGVAEALGRGMFTIDLSGVVSKYIGETEKNLRALFDLAEAGEWVLFFDEADSLFGKRTKVRDSHDRYANIGVAYLRKRLDALRGLLILGTDDAERIDPAFLRRAAAVVPLARGRATRS